MTGYWIGVASADHVACGVAGGFAQLGHGKRAPLARLQRGDRLIYYAPREKLGGGDTVQAFVAIGTVTDEAPVQHGTGTAGPDHPWRRAIEFDQQAQRAQIHPLLDRLHLTRDRGAHWGILFRRSLIAIDAHDVAVIEQAMHRDIARH